MLIVLVQQLPRCLIHKCGECRETQGGAGYCDSPAGFLSFHEKGQDLGTDCKQAVFSYLTDVFPPQLCRTKEVLRGLELTLLLLLLNYRSLCKVIKPSLLGEIAPPLMKNKVSKWLLSLLSQKALWQEQFVGRDWIIYIKVISTKSHRQLV